MTREEAETVVPTEFHRKPPRKHGSRCPVCGAPGRIHGLHRMIPSKDGETSSYAYLKRCGKESVELVYRRRDRNGVGKGVKHRYPAASNRKSPTAKVQQRIINATRLFAYGLTWKQVAARLGISDGRLFGNRADHRELWDLCFAEATKNTAEVLKQLAGTPEIFANGGKLIRVAGEVAQQQSVPLVFPSDNGDGKQTLSTFLENVYLPSRIGICGSYTDHLRSRVRQLVAFLGKDISIDELNEADLCRFLTALRQSRGAVTVNKARQAFLTLWRNAYDYGLCNRPPRLGLIRRVPEEIDPPEAWTAEECNRLFSTAARQEGTVGDVLACNWWLSLFLTIYWTSNRISAMLAVESKHYDRAGILVRKQKNHRPQWFPLPESCREVIDRIRPADRKLLWGHPWHPRTVWTKARTIIEGAGLPCPQTGRQVFHRLRRSTITMCAAVDPAVAQRTAGHQDYATTQRHYIDPRHVHAKSAVDILPEPVITKPKSDQAGDDAAA